MTFQPNKTLKELNIDTSRKFVLVNDQSNNLNKGDILVISEDDNSAVPYFKRVSDGKEGYCLLSNLEYYRDTITWDTLEIGDEVIDENGDSRWVLDIHGRVINLSERGNKDSCGWAFTKEELIKRNYTIVQPETQKETVDPEVEKAIKFLEDKGIIKEGKIIS